MKICLFVLCLILGSIPTSAEARDCYSEAQGAFKLYLHFDGETPVPLVTTTGLVEGRFQCTKIVFPKGPCSTMSCLSRPDWYAFCAQTFDGTEGTPNGASFIFYPGWRGPDVIRYYQADGALVTEASDALYCWDSK